MATQFRATAKSISGSSASQMEGQMVLDVSGDGDGISLDWNGQRVKVAASPEDLALKESLSNKVDISDASTSDNYPNAKSVWDLIQNVAATVPAGGLKVPTSLALESQLPADPTTLVSGDYFFIQNMDVTANGRTGRVWVNYTDPSDKTTPLMYYKVIDQYFDVDGESVLLSNTGLITISTSWLDTYLAPYAKLTDVSSAQFAANVPDLTNLENINRFSTSVTSWTADRDGFINFFLSAADAICWLKINNQYAYGAYRNCGITVPIRKGDIVSWQTQPANSPPTSVSLYYTPSAGITLPTINETFSTTETNTGKMYNGRAVYRRRFNSSITISTPNAIITSVLIPSGIQQIVSVNGQLGGSSFGYYRFGNNAGDVITSHLTAISGVLSLNVYGPITNAYSYDIWVEYTKT